MNKLKSLLFIGSVLFCIGFPSQNVIGQTPSDAILMPKHQACVLLNYDHSSFNEYWEGTLLRGNQTIETVNRITVLPMIAVGILDKLDVYIGLPYIKTSSTVPNGGKFAGVSGFQDISLSAKYRVLDTDHKKGKFNLFTTLGFSTPATNYLSDYMPYSLGFGASQITTRAIAQYKLNTGLYFRLSGAYLFRGYTEAERDYYYNEGSYYTAWMDVPNAIELNAVAGIWLMNDQLKLEMAYSGVKSTSGDDIRPYNAAQPTNKAQFDQVSISAQYYFSQPLGPGILIYHRRVVNGRNAPKMVSYGAGVTYQFAYKNASIKTDENE